MYLLEDADAPFILPLLGSEVFILLPVRYKRLEFSFSFSKKSKRRGGIRKESNKNVTKRKKCIDFI